jgi:tRNA uridine 5-carboxymethylaminomethyl modification enzyme
VHKRSIDFSKLEKQASETNIRFSHEKQSCNLPLVSCHISHTTARTKAILQKNLKRSALFSGKIQGIGPRYCPSIEDKIVRFSHKETHQAFLEPEGLESAEIYISGISSSMPFDVQLDVIRSMDGMEKAEIMRPAYAIEYDWVESGQITNTLESRLVKNLFFAGQINGTTGYEEAAAQGLAAGINAANRALLPSEEEAQKRFLLKRSEAYLGVMIDDLITKEVTEPYRLFTSRAEHRLLLRQDNAEERLFETAFLHKTISEERYHRLKAEKELIEEEKKRLAATYVYFEKKRSSLKQLLGRPEINYEKLLELFPSQVRDLSAEINRRLEIELKYSGYLVRQEKEVRGLDHLEKTLLPEDFAFDLITGLRTEAKEKLKKFRPPNLGAASRINGVSPADISVLLVFLQKKRLKKIPPV